MSADTTPSPRPAPAHAADGGEYGETDDFGRGSTDDTTGSYQLPPDGGPAPAGDAGPTAGDDGPVLLPVDPPDDRYEGQADDRVDDPTETRVDDRLDDRLDDDRVDDRADEEDALPGDDTYVAESDHTDGLPTPAPAPVAADDLSSEPAADGGGVTSSPISGSGTDDDWHELQSKFVDDPAAAVKDAGALVEHALSDLRSRLESGDTEELRTAFKRYRDLYSSLS